MRDMAQTVGGIIGTLVAETNFSCSASACYPEPLTRGDRVRIREGYDGAGTVCSYVGKSTSKPDVVRVLGWANGTVLAAAIEPYPYTREERIERVIEDYVGAMRVMDQSLNMDMYPDHRNLLFAILEAGV
jgi:hypothetical protein